MGSEKLQIKSQNDSKHKINLQIDGYWSLKNTHLATFHKFKIPYILESNLHPFYGFRGLKNQTRIRFAVESWILEKDRTAVRAVKTIQ